MNIETIRTIKKNIFEGIQNESNFIELKETLESLFIKLDIEIENYNVEEEYRKKHLTSIIKILNKISLVFETLGYTDLTSKSADQTEEIFQDQLVQYSNQAYKLIKDFDRAYFMAFAVQTYYLEYLSELHYTNKYGKSKIDDEPINEETEDIAINAGIILEELPELPENELK